MYEEFGEIINTMKFNSYDYTENITITLNALNDRKMEKLLSVRPYMFYGVCASIKSKTLETY